MFHLYSVCFLGLILSEASAYNKTIGNVTFEPIIEGDTREIYKYEQTMVIRDLMADGQVRRCDMIVTTDGFPDGQQPTLDEIVIFLPPDSPSVQHVEMNEIFKIMASCDAIDEQSFVHNFFDAIRPYAKVVRAISPLFFGSQSLSDELALASKDISSALGKVWRNIVPRTKWCGRGNVADSYHDLGELRSIDRCCRTHDYCPIKIRGNGELYGLKNEKDYTTSHCICDAEFYNCLKRTNEYAAGQLGVFYFSLLRPQCIQGLPSDNSTESGDEGMRFVPTERRWYDA